MLWTALICGEHNDKKIIKTHSFECTWKNFRHCMIAYHNWDTCNEMKLEGSQSNISFPLKKNIYADLFNLCFWQSLFYSGMFSICLEWKALFLKFNKDNKI